MRPAPDYPRQIGDAGDTFRLQNYRDQLMVWLGETIQEAVERLEVALAQRTHEHDHQWKYQGTGSGRTRRCSICFTFEAAPM